MAKEDTPKIEKEEENKPREGSKPNED